MSYSAAYAKEDTYRLIEQAKAGCEEARELLVRQNTGLVRSAALKFVFGAAAGSGCELDDLLQVGFIGLLKAVERFDAGYNVMFSTYAVPMILGEIRRYLRDDGRVKVSRQVKQDVRRMQRAQEEFCQREGRSPRISELADMMGSDTEYVLSLMEAAEALSGAESLDDPERSAAVSDGRYREEEDLRADMIQLKAVIGKLGERERQIVVMRYFKDMTQQQIADRLGISQVQVSRLEKKIISALREEMTCKIENLQ